jgi:hypothetical protein
VDACSRPNARAQVTLSGSIDWSRVPPPEVRPSGEIFFSAAVLSTFALPKPPQPPSSPAPALPATDITGSDSEVAGPSVSDGTAGVGEDAVNSDDTNQSETGASPPVAASVDAATAATASDSEGVQFKRSKSPSPSPHSEGSGGGDAGTATGHEQSPDPRVSAEDNSQSAAGTDMVMAMVLSGVDGGDVASESMEHTAVSGDVAEDASRQRLRGFTLSPSPGPGWKPLQQVGLPSLWLFCSLATCLSVTARDGEITHSKSQQNVFTRN